jgi:hypothetical protein
MGRGLVPKTVRLFKGMVCHPSVTRVPENYALDCLNVLCNGSGGLSKLRAPTVLSAQLGALEGPATMFDFQNGYGVRQLVVASTYYMYYFNIGTYTSTPILGAVTTPVTWSWREANNLLFGANGENMKKWDGISISNWGIEQGMIPLVTGTSGVLAAADVALDNPLYPIGGNLVVAGALGARLYWYAYTFSNNFGETLISPLLGTEIPAGNVLEIPPPADYPAGATGWSFYCDIHGGGNLTLQSVGGVTLWGFGATITEPVTGFTDSGMPVPTENTTGEGTTEPDPLTLTVGRKYRIAYGNSMTGHVGAASDASASSGAVAADAIELTIPNSDDPQVDLIYVFATMDGGEDYYLNFIIAPSLGPSTVITDQTKDADLNTAIIAPMLNYPPAVCKYVAKFQGRMFCFGNEEAPQDIWFSGYERIFLGRPEESFPPNNRIRLGIGADVMRGAGETQAGIVFMSRSDEMYMLRGTIEDRTTDEPIQYTADLEELPWNQGCASHYSVVKSPYGMVWLASDKSVKIFDGTNEPKTISEAVNPILRSITPGTEEMVQGVFFCFLEKEVYILLCAIEGETRCNRILIFDLNPDKDENFGCTPLAVRADSIRVVEDENGLNHVLILQDGILKELTILTDTTGGITNEYTATDEIVPAYWFGGYFGQSNPEVVKCFRYGKLITDQIGFRVVLRLIHEENGYTFREPYRTDPQLIDGTHIEADLKGRRLGVDIWFPEQDVSANVLELTMLHIQIAEY